MIKKLILITLIICFLGTLSSCRDKDTVAVMKIQNKKNSYCDIYTYQEEKEEYTNYVSNFIFPEGEFYFNKLDFIGEDTNEYYTYTLELQGNQIDISYVDEDKESDEKDAKTVFTTSDYSNLNDTTLYIETDLEYLVTSVPSVYEKTRIYDSIQTDESVEKPVKITKGDGVFYITYAFPKDKNYLSEFFYLKSDLPLVIMNKDTKKLLVQNELSGRFRLVSDGFYQSSYENYYPTGDGNYFRNCANYIATHYINYNNSVDLDNTVRYFDYIAYASTFVANQQISEYGFFETKSRSNWLYRDFLINKDYYDTRFNADNAELNLLMYKRFGDESFLNTLNIYGEFFVKYCDEHSYMTARGCLTEDYYNPSGGLQTHSSLNHHLANMNVMISLYELTQNQQYLNTAMKMLYGIEDTENEWILENSDLNYALYYNGTNNIMKDYPYLTYNDLFIAKQRLQNIGIASDSIDNLMTAKKIYMDSNNITGYYE